MNRGLVAAWSWRRALWVRKSPGVMGGIAFLFLPLFFFLPWETLSFFGERLRGIGVLTWVFSIALALQLRGGQDLRDETAIWTIQKGISQGDVALEDWLLDMALLTGYSLWMGLFSLLALWASGEPFYLSASAGFLCLGLTTCLVTHTLTFFLSALGAKRTSDPTALLAVLSILVPVLSLGMPGWLRIALDWLLPPFQACLELSGAVRASAFSGIGAALLHILAFSGILLWMGVWRVSRWRPLV
jgi:hypothetical protein